MMKIGAAAYHAAIMQRIDPTKSGVFSDAMGLWTSAGTATSSRQNGIDSRPPTATQSPPVKLSNAHRLDSAGLKVGRTWEASEEAYQSIVRGYQLSLEADYRGERVSPDLSNYAAIKPYADVVIGGLVVATIDNQGCAATDDDVLGKKITSLMAEHGPGDGNGPDLAQAVAEQIAALVGGRVVQKGTAIMQAAFDALPPPPEAYVMFDDEGMRADPRYEQLQTLMRNRADYLARQSPETGSVV